MVERTGGHDVENPANDHLFVSDDNQQRVYDIDPGPDALPGTTDDTRTSFKTTDYGSSDPEGIAYGGGALFISDGVGKEIYRVDPRTGGFNGVAPAGDDLVSHFDTATLGVTDPEGVEYNPTTGHLFIVSRGEKRITETTQSGALVAHLDISSSGIKKPAGVALAPGSTAPSQTHVYVADRASDNDSNPNENDGKIYEFALSGGAGNTAPVANAGPDRSIALTGSAQLSGSVADDGLPNGTLTAQWSTTSGPGTVTFAAPTSPATSATFSQAGTYVLRLTADDSAQTHWDEMTVLVTAGTGTSVQEIPVVGGSNNAEEKPTGGMRLTSTDLDLVDAGDSPGPQTVGLRFTGVGVPAGATNRGRLRPVPGRRGVDGVGIDGDQGTGGRQPGHVRLRQVRRLVPAANRGERELGPGAVERQERTRARPAHPRSDARHRRDHEPSRVAGRSGARRHLHRHRDPHGGGRGGRPRTRSAHRVLPLHASARSPVRARACLLGAARWSRESGWATRSD